MKDDDTLTIVHDRDANRYELFVDGARGAHLDYRIEDNTITYTHTVTEPSMRGRGIAARVVQNALDEARADKLIVVPECWYVAQFIDQHPEYADLVSRK